MAGYTLPVAIPRQPRSPRNRPRRDFVVTAGDDVTLELTVYTNDAGGAAVDVTDSVTTWTIYGDGGTALVTVTGTIEDAVSGRIDVALVEADTTDIAGRFPHSLRIEFANGMATVVNGVVNIQSVSGAAGESGVLPDADECSECSDRPITLLEKADHGEVTIGTLDLVIETQTAQVFTLAAADTVLTVTADVSPSVVMIALLFITQDDVGIRTITWPANFRWQGGFSPSLSTAAGATDVVQIMTYDGGVTWLAAISLQVAAA